MIKISNISYSYNDRKVLDNVNLEINEGEFVLVIGPSGGGKTTLSQLINGIIPNDIKGSEFSGEVIIDELNTINQSSKLANGIVGTVLQDPEWQFVSGTVIEELTFSMENNGLDIREMDKRLDFIVKQLEIEHLLHESPVKLSGGQKQRVAIAASLMMNPKILVLDEPTAELDPIGKKDILELVKSLNASLGLTVIFVDHNLDISFPYADRVIMVANGKIVADAHPSVLFENPVVAKWVEMPQVIEIARHLKQKVSGFCDQDPLEAKELSEMIIKKFPDCYHHRYSKMDEGLIREEDNGSALKLEHVSFNYNTKSDQLILKNINLEIGKQDFIALIGQNGAGKSTLSKLIMGLIKPTVGRVFLGGKNISSMDVNEIISRVGYVFQNPDYQMTQKSVFDEIAFGLKLRNVPLDMIEQKVNEAANIFNITNYLNRHPHFLSRGERRRVAIASTLILEPDVIILDEPTTGLDSIRCREMMEYITKLNEKGITIIFLTHDMGVVTKYIPKTMIMANGELQFFGQTRDAFRHIENFHQYKIDVPPVVDLSNRLQWEHAALSTMDFIGEMESISERNAI